MVRAFSAEERKARRDTTEPRCSESAQIAIASANESDAITRKISGEVAGEAAPRADPGTNVYANTKGRHFAARRRAHVGVAFRGIKPRKLPVLFG